MENICQGYNETNQRTLKIWQHEPVPHAINPFAFPPHNALAITSGIRPVLPPAAQKVLAEITQRNACDPLAEVQIPSQLHFTFLAITPAIFDRMPDEAMLASLRLSWPGPCLMRIRNLRLIALPNQLLLAGEPDFASLNRRRDLVNQLLNSPWKQGLQQRYQQDSLPPLFWHSTLLRYRASTLPPPLRDYFIARRHRDFGEVQASVELVLSDYHWRQVTPIPCG